MEWVPALGVVHFYQPCEPAKPAGLPVNKVESEMGKRVIPVVATLLFVLAISITRGFGQEQIVLNSTGLELKVVALDFPDYKPLPNGPRGFVDLVDLRLRCDKIQVKVASWMKGLSGIPSLRLVYVADDETILPVTEVTYPGG